MSHQCEFSSETAHGYQKVMVHYGLNLCEIGENCHDGCPYSFKPEDVEPCSECHGSPLDNPAMSCPKCDVFGIQRKAK